MRLRLQIPPPKTTLGVLLAAFAIFSVIALLHRGSSRTPPTSPAPDLALGDTAQNETDPTQIKKTPIIFAGLSGIPPRFVEDGPMKGMGWMEHQTFPIRKGLIQDGFTIQSEYMTPARIAHEFRVRNPICVYPTEWSNPKQTFAKKPSRIYSIPYSIGGDSTSFLVARTVDLPKFNRHRDGLGNIKLEDLLRDPNLKTQLIRDKDYGMINSLVTSIDAQGDQIVKKEFERTISLRVLSDNRQTLEMLNASRFDYAFDQDIESDDYGRSKIDPRSFTRLPFKTPSVIDPNNPNLIYVSVSCSDTGVTRLAMAHINEWISLNRGTLMEERFLNYKELIEFKHQHTLDRLPSESLRTTERFRGSFQAGKLDQWYSLQQRTFSNLRLFPTQKDPLPSPAARHGFARKADAPSWKLWIASAGSLILLQEGGESARFDDIRNRSERTNLHDELSQLYSTSLAPFLTLAETQALRSKGAKKRGTLKDLLKDPSLAHPAALTVLGDPGTHEDREALKSFLKLSSLEVLRAFQFGPESSEALVSQIPNSVRELSLVGLSLSSTKIEEKIIPLKLRVLNLSNSQITAKQLQKILPQLAPLEHLCLSYLRSAWNLENAKRFSELNFKNLKALEIENSALSDPWVKEILKAIPRTIESLNLSKNFLTSMSISPLLARPLPKLRELNLSLSALGATKDRPIRFPPHLKKLALKASWITDAQLAAFTLPLSLESLDLSQNSISDASVPTLSRSLFDRMELLDLSLSRITEQGVGEIASKRSIQRLRLSGLRLDNSVLKAISEQKELIELDLSGNKITTLEPNTSIRRLLGQLLSLDLSETALQADANPVLFSSLNPDLLSLKLRSIRSLDLSALAKFLPKKLEVLDLGFNQISDSEIETLASALPPSLKHLGLGQSGFRLRGALALARSMPQNLQFLDLKGTPLGAPGLIAIAQALPTSISNVRAGHATLSEDEAQKFSASLPRGLQALWINNINLTSTGMDRLISNLPKGLRRLRLYTQTPFLFSPQNPLELAKSLREIYFEGVQLTHPSSRHFFGGIPQSLERLGMLGSGLNDTDLGTLSQIGLKNLHMLQTPENQFSSQGLTAFLSTVENCRTINLVGNRYSTVPMLSGFTPKTLLSLRVIRISRVSYEPDDLVHFLKKLPDSLSVLDIASVNLSSNEVPRILESLPNGLHCLYVSGNNLGDKGFNALKRFKQNKELKESVPFDLHLD